MDVGSFAPYLPPLCDEVYWRSQLQQRWQKLTESGWTAISSNPIPLFLWGAFGTGPPPQIALAKVWKKHWEASETSEPPHCAMQRYLRLSYGLYAARIGGELFIREGRFDEAKASGQKAAGAPLPHPLGPAWGWLAPCWKASKHQAKKNAQKVW